MARLIALFILVFPGIAAVYGVKLMRDTLFNSLNAPFPYLWLQFITGIVVFFGGLTFIGGWIYFRDKKRNYVVKRSRGTKSK